MASEQREERVRVVQANHVERNRLGRDVARSRLHDKGDMGFIEP